MTIDLSKLKALAEAAKRDPYDHLAANDYGMSMPPATALELIAELERHRLVVAEGCKPEISTRPVGGHTADTMVMHGLDKAEGCKPDLINSPFFYALAGPDGKPHYDDFCVANSPADLECHEEGITIVPLYRHPAPTVQQGVPIGYMNQVSIDAVQHDGQALIMVGVNGFPPGDQAIPVYTHADPGETERLRKELEIALSDIKVEQRVSHNLRQHKTDYMEAAEETRNALLAQLAIARAALQRVMHATDDSQDDGAHHQNAYSIADHALNNMMAACRHLNVVPRSTITDGKLIGHFCKDCGIPSASAEQAAGLSEVLPAAAVEGDQLVIRITTECLLHAVTCSSQWPVDETGTPIRINNGPLLIQEIIHELQREDEQGTNAMHRMFDDAALDALNNGSEAVDYDEVHP